jgi:hypothetical protein
MWRRCVCLFTIPFLVMFSSRAPADDFDDLEGPALASVPARQGVTARERLTLTELGHLPAVLRDARSPLLVVKTDQGNLARVLAGFAFRKPAEGAGEPVPILVLERFATLEAGKATTRLARGHDVMLFDGFRFDLDSGQVVPDGQGGDLQFLSSAPEGPRVVTLGAAKIYTFNESPVAGRAPSPRPSAGRAVVASDFAGRYRLYANGQWSGALELKLADQGAITGQFRSDLNGATYAVAGQVAADVPQKIRFSVRYPRARQDFEGYLWTEGKGAMAGVVTLLDRPYGFFAIREGGRYAPEGDEVAGPLSALDADRPGRLVVEVVGGDRFRLDGKTLSDVELTAALQPRVRAEPPAWVLLRVPGSLPFSAASRAIDLIRAARVATIRLATAPAADQPKP